ncbi:MAG: serine/threonine-protein kinase, partial [Candidatus Acidiferrum sp.]
MSRKAHHNDSAGKKAGPSSQSPLTPVVTEDTTLSAPPGSSSADGSFTTRAQALGLNLPDFELIGVLGRGGMGVVYKARQKSLDRIVAIKMLLDEHGQNEHALARFHSEARAAAALNHPNIVGIHQVGECAFGHFFTMEYIDGHTLQEILDSQTPQNRVPIAWAVSLLITVAEAVHYAHSKGIIHRDLKPGNIMIEKSKRPIVMDFGVAKVMGKASNLTGQGVAMGTPSYMPPEQAGEGPREVGIYSDVYSLGAILYRLITGRLAYDAE